MLQIPLKHQVMLTSASQSRLKRQELDGFGLLLVTIAPAEVATSTGVQSKNENHG